MSFRKCRNSHSIDKFVVVKWFCQTNNKHWN